MLRRFAFAFMASARCERDTEGGQFRLIGDAKDDAPNLPGADIPRRSTRIGKFTREGTESQETLQLVLRRLGAASTVSVACAIDEDRIFRPV